MNPLTHFFIGWGVANLGRADKRERAMVTLAGIVPDVDGFGIIVEKLTAGSKTPLLWWSDYHHVLAHNIGFCLAFTAGCMVFAKRRVRTALLILVSFHLHLLGDIIGARGPMGEQWPIPYLLPFSSSLNLSYAHQWALNAWPNFVITAVMIAFALYWAVQRGYSPLEMISEKADAAFVKTLRARFASK